MESADAIAVAKDALLSLVTVLAAGCLGGMLAKRLRVPDVAIFLLIGILIGPAMMGLVAVPAESALNQFILIFGACYLLFDGGATLRFAVLKEVWVTIVIIATFGVLVTAGVTAAAAHWFLGLPMLVALLLGSALAPTDPATLVPIFKQIKIKDRVAQTVISESAFNDATGAILTFTVLGLAAGTAEFSALDALVRLGREAGLGVVTGAALGYAAAYLIANERHAYLRDFAPIVTLMGVGGAFLGADLMHGSGFMAVFVFGILVGNRGSFGLAMDPKVELHMEEYVLSTALVFRLLIFVLLGTQVSFELMARYWLPGVGVVLVFMLVARPLTVFICASADRRARWSFKEMVFMCWTRETGVIPAALAGLLLGLKAPGAEIIASITFIAVLMTILIQAPTTRWLARKLGLLVEA